jgi:hypothetical protein
MYKCNDCNHIFEIPTGGTGEVKKSAGYFQTAWIDPKGQIYELAGGEVHGEWLSSNLDLLASKYGIVVPKYLYQQVRNYFDAIEEGIENVDMPDYGEIWEQMIDQGWVRVGDSQTGYGVELKDLKQIPSYVDSYLADIMNDGDIVEVTDNTHTLVQIQYPFKSLQQLVNRALMSTTKTAKYEKEAMGPMSGWLTPDGQFYPVTTTHNTWMNKNQNLLKTKYGIDPATDPTTKNFDVGGGDYDPVSWLISKGFSRVDGYLPTELNMQIADINNPPQALERFIWKYNPKVVILEDLKGNDVALDDFSKGLDKALLNPIAKKADSCYTDKQLEEQYTKQHEYSDDPGGGFTPHDWNQSTSDYPKPKDLEVYKVRLDQLQKPIDRYYPPGLPEYTVTQYLSLPMSDGIEAFDG